MSAGLDNRVKAPSVNGHSEPTRRPTAGGVLGTTRLCSRVFTCQNLCLALLAVVTYVAFFRSRSLNIPITHEVKHPCSPPLPPFLTRYPPATNDVHVGPALDKLNSSLTAYFDHSDLESVSIAVVTTNGSLYEGFWGDRRANETQMPPTAPDRDTIYRLASISKLFTSIETFVLRDRGVLSLDDPIEKWLPNFKYHTYYGPITIRALMSHMSGLGRDLPPGNASGSWPHSLFGGGPPPSNGRPFASLDEVLTSIAQEEPVLPPWTYPVYSNTGFSLLGMANVAANRAKEGTGAPTTHAELLDRDVLKPLGLTRTMFLLDRESRKHAAVSSVHPGVIDQDFLDLSNPSGGQMSSLADLTRISQMLLGPEQPDSVIYPHSVREWIRPLYAWHDEFSDVGALWEIHSSTNSFGQTQKLYQKLGELPGHHTALTLNPSSSYAVVVLTTGPTAQVIELTNLIFKHIQPAVDKAQAEVAHSKLVGTWISEDRRSHIEIALRSGSLFVDRYMLDGTDVLAVMQGNEQAQLDSLPLWSTSLTNFRIAVPSKYDGCFHSWVSLDNYGYTDGVSVNNVRMHQKDGESHLYLPGVSLDMVRVR